MSSLLMISFLSAHAEMRTEPFSFSFEGKVYSGLLDLPGQKPAGAMVIIVPGSGKTDVVAGNWYHNTRIRFAEQGLACVVWDKAGCGKSEGVFDYGQTVQNSAAEVLAAIAELRSRNVMGSERIGLWGISRAGWICPLVIRQYPVAFWISVSGTDDKETFAYMLEKNIHIEGKSKAQAKKLKNEWLKGIEVARTGGTFEEHLKATENLRKDPFYIHINGGNVPTLEGYLKWQKRYRTGENLPVDEKSGLPVYVTGFDNVLNNVNCPVLAIFGEKDSQVDWKKTRALYKKTIGKNPRASLTIKTFPNGNHSIYACKTGGYREALEKGEYCEGYFETMLSWLREKEFGN